MGKRSVLKVMKRIKSMSEMGSNDVQESTAAEAIYRLRLQVAAWYSEAQRCMARAREIEDIIAGIEQGTVASDPAMDPDALQE